MKKQISKQPVTKKDLSVLKKDVSSFRSEFKSTKKSIFEQMLGLEEKIEKVDEKLDQKFDRVMTTLDGIAKGVADLQEENAAGTLQYRRLRNDVDGHEKRITRLESTQTP